MITQLFTPDQIDLAAEIIRAGGIVGMPTETVYGLAASAVDEEAVKKVFIAKGRPQDNPLIVHISDFDQIYGICATVPETAVLMAERFWPGPFTMVLPKLPVIPDRVTGDMGTVAVRLTAHPVARAFIRSCGVPIAAPSANTSGYPSPTTAAHVMRDLNGKIDACIDGGPCGCGVESTVVSLVHEPRLLRPGGITLEQLQEIVPEIVVDKALRGEVKADEKVSAPGMKYRHYAPAAPVIAVCGEPEASAAYIAEHIQKNEIFICYNESVNAVSKDSCLAVLPYGSCADRITLAQGIFAALRDADRLGSEKIYVQCPDDRGIGLAVANRIKKAAGFHVVQA